MLNSTGERESMVTLVCTKCGNKIEVISAKVEAWHTKCPKRELKAGAPTYKVKEDPKP